MATRSGDNGEASSEQQGSQGTDANSGSQNANINGGIGGRQGISERVGQAGGQAGNQQETAGNINVNVSGGQRAANQGTGVGPSGRAQHPLGRIIRMLTGQSVRAILENAPGEAEFIYLGDTAVHRGMFEEILNDEVELDGLAYEVNDWIYIITGEHPEADNNENHPL